MNTNIQLLKRKFSACNFAFYPIHKLYTAWPCNTKILLYKLFVRYLVIKLTCVTAVYSQIYKIRLFILLVTISPNGLTLLTRSISTTYCQDNLATYYIDVVVQGEAIEPLQHFIIFGLPRSWTP